MRTLEIVHRTRYDYSAPVTLGEHRLMFRPRDSHDLRLLYTGLAIDPAAQCAGSTMRSAIRSPSPSSMARPRVLELTSTIRLEHFGLPPELPPIEDYARKLPFAYLAEEAPDLARYVERHYPDPNATVSSWAKQFLEGEDGTDTFAMLTHMCKGIQETLNYAMRFEVGTQAPAVTLESGGGTCRDYALLMMEGVRALGLAARFITGYLYDPALDDAAGGASSPAHPHAWMEVYLPGAGWVEFDPTNGIIGTERLIRVAVGRDPEQAMPIKGTFTGAADVAINTLVDVQVRTLAPATDAVAEAPAPPPPVPTAPAQTPITQS